MRPFELGAKNINESSVDDSTSSEIDISEENAIIDLDIPIRICIDFTNQENTLVMNFTVVDLDDPLSLVYPKLIDWDQTLNHDIWTFQNDYAILSFLSTDNPKSGSHNAINSKVSTQGGVIF
jgi:hypothetical protein